MNHKKTYYLQEKRLNNVALVIGVIILIICFATLLWVIPCPTPFQGFMLRSLTAIGTACIATVIPGIFHINIFGIRAGSAIGIFVLVYLYNPAKFINNSDKCDIQFTSCTVFVHGKGGKQDMILRQKGFVIMDLGGGERGKQSINENGQAFFQNLLIGDSVRLNIDFSEPYKSINPDSIFVIKPNGEIYLAVELQGIDSVFGKVFYHDFPLDSVIVEIGSLSTTTNNLGNFNLKIPEKMQKKEYKVWLIKKGFKSKSVPSFPETGEPLEIVMEKR